MSSPSPRPRVSPSPGEPCPSGDPNADSCGSYDMECMGGECMDIAMPEVYVSPA